MFRSFKYWDCALFMRRYYDENFCIHIGVMTENHYAGWERILLASGYLWILGCFGGPTGDDEGVGIFFGHETPKFFGDKRHEGMEKF